MKKNDLPSNEQLKSKYSADIFGNPPAMTGKRLLERLAEWDILDQHFTRTSFDFAARMQRRKVLDDRTRWLVQAGQFTCTKNFGHLEDVLRAAIEGGVKVREVLESILLCQVYAGDTALVPALEVFTRVADE